MAQDIAISVVIPARDSGDTILLTVASVLEQSYPPLEIVVVSSPGDTTKAPLAPYIANGLVRYVEVETIGYVRDAHYKRWVGAHEARGSHIFFTDAKALLKRDALESAIRSATHYGVEVVAGIARSWPTLAHRFISKVQDAALIKNNPSFGNAQFLDANNFGKTEHLPVTTALLISQKVFRAIELDFALEFSKVASTYDDYATAWLIARAGYLIVCTGTVVSYHRHRGWRGYMRQIARSGQSAALLIDFYPDCPFGWRRLRQVLLFVGLHFFFVVGTLALTLLSGNLTTLWLIPIVGGTSYAIAGCVNALRCKKITAFLIPSVTYLLVAIFSYHFLACRLRRQKAASRLPLKYLQVD